MPNEHIDFRLLLSFGDAMCTILNALNDQGYACMDLLQKEQPILETCGLSMLLSAVVYCGVVSGI